MLSGMSDTRVPAIKVVLLPKDTNAYGTIFGGVILAHIDLASAVEARKLGQFTFVTKAMREVVFVAPVFLGDDRPSKDLNGVAARGSESVTRSDRSSCRTSSSSSSFSSSSSSGGGSSSSSSGSGGGSSSSSSCSGSSSRSALRFRP